MSKNAFDTYHRCSYSRTSGFRKSSNLTLRERAEASISESIFSDLDEGSALLESLLTSLSAMGDGLMVIECGRFSYVNQALCEMTGYSEDELLGMSSFLELQHPGEHEKIMQNHQRRMAGEKFYTRYDTVYIRRDGSLLDVEIAASRLYTGNRLGTVVAVRDISERKRAEADLRRYTQDLERSNKALDDFAYIASHDLKEPLRGIHNYTNFLLEDYVGLFDEQGRHYVERMQRLSERLTLLIDRILRYSRLGSASLNLGQIDLDRLLSDVLEDLHPFLTERGVQVRLVAPLGIAECDGVWIGEMFQNLITNAAKYNDKTEKWIEIGTASRNGLRAYYVRDNGIGIPAQHRETIFRIFKRLHGQDQFGGGTGAGLTIVKKIVERHQGQIWIESEEGFGTCFHFTLGNLQSV